MKGADSKIHVIGHMRIFLPTSENICLRLNQMQVQWSSVEFSGVRVQF